MANPLYDHLFAPLAGRDRPLLILPDGATISGAAFLGMVHRAAHALQANGVGTGDRVAVQVPKSVAALAVYGAAVTLGAVLLPLNTAYQPAEVDYFLGNAAPKLLLADPMAAADLTPIAAAHGARLLTLDAEGKGSFSDLTAGQSDDFTPAARGNDDLAALLYTSGTTGRSKGAMLTQGNLLSNAQVLAQEWRFSADDVQLHALPIYHTHGLFVGTNIALLTGGAMIFLPGFDREAILRLLPQASVLMGVPTFYTRLLADPRLTRERVAKMRLFISGSAPLLADTHQEFEQRTGHRILERYGMTETNMNTSNPHDGERRAGTVGRPLPGVEVIVTDPESGDLLPQGEIGMVEVRGPNVCTGYWQMPDKTAEAMRANGFFITGDLGRFDAAGYLTIVGREKDLIITGGLNVYPKEIELILDEQLGVLESAVIGIPDPDFGEVVLGVIVPHANATPDLAAIMASLVAQLARFKQPRGLVLVPELPRNTMGKVQKNILRDQFADWSPD